VSFSDKRVADLVNSKFIPAWTNRGPGFFNAEFWAERNIAEHDYEAYPTKNICTFFLTPDGKVFYYVAGSYSPELFVKILETAVALRSKLFDDRMQLREKGLAEALTYHQDKSEDYGDLKDDAARSDNWKSLTRGFRMGNYRGLKHVHSESCAWALKNGYEYLAALHREWAGRKELPELESVRYQYLYGNEFTEETPDSHHIASPGTPPPPPLPTGPKRFTAQKVEAKGGKDLFGIGTPSLKVLGQ
jgi:hypothetical protein